jgi:hypothetical protein
VPIESRNEKDVVPLSKYVRILVIWMGGLMFLVALVHMIIALSNASVTVTVTGREAVTKLSGTATKQ